MDLLSIDQFRNVAGESNKRSASVNGRAGILKFQNVVTKFDAFKFDLPVRFLAKGDVVDLAGIMLGVNATEYCLTAIFFR